MSQFIKTSDNYPSDHPEGIDFANAVRLPAGGSICDVYRTRWQRRDVFVKRLKEEYRHKPLYLDALDKEFDIGINLRHPSLPEYREFHRDHIVMDYIDGMTLDEMIKAGDPWLAAERNVVRMLRELVEVVDYLHRHNVVHCDIKPDNIIITANNKNLVLIDFDKSYTDALSDTSGHPAKYGLTTESIGSIAIDFHGIGRVVERLKKELPAFRFARYKKFTEACCSPAVNCEALLAILNYDSKSHARQNLALICALILVTAASGIYLLTKPAKESPTASESPAITAPPPDANTTQTELHASAKARAAMLDARIQPAFSELIADLDRLLTLKADSTLSAQQLIDRIRLHGDLADEYITEAFEILNETYPGITDREAWRIMSYSKAYTGYSRRATPELKEYGLEIERRLNK